MNRGARIMQILSDTANPVVVKELRQAVQSRLVIAILLLFLLVNVVIVSGYLVLGVDIVANERAGADLFSALFVVLVLTCIVFVPLYAAVRLTMERNDSNIDLLFITTIPPAAIIRGKFWAAVALTALIYSASSPFLTFTYLLRGVDLPSIFFSLGAAFLLTTLAIMLAIFVGSVAGGLLLRILMAGGLLYLGGLLAAGAIAVGTETARFGLAANFRRDEMWAVLGALLLLGVGAWGLLYLLSVAAVSARSSNRMFPIRVFLTVCWLILGVVCGIWTYVKPGQDALSDWGVGSLAVLSLILALTLAERESWSPRVRRNIPRATLPRLLAWLFYTGSAGGVIWASLLGVATLIVSLAALEQLSHISIHASISRYLLYDMCGVLLFTWCYGLSGLFVRRMFLPNSPPIASTTIGVALLAIGGALPMFVAYMVLGSNWHFDDLPIAYVIANPCALARSDTDLVDVFIFLAIWAGLVLLLNIPWFHQQWQAFRRYEPKPVSPPIPLPAEPPVVHV